MQSPLATLLVSISFLAKSHGLTTSPCPPQRVKATAESQAASKEELESKNASSSKATSPGPSAETGTEPDNDADGNDNNDELDEGDDLGEGSSVSLLRPCSLPPVVPVGGVDGFAWVGRRVPSTKGVVLRWTAFRLLHQSISTFATRH